MLNENNTGCLFKKNKQGKILVWSATYIKATFIGSIHIEYGQYGGKIQKEITNVEPKANRTLDDQLVLEITSLYNKQRDKGYKSAKDLGIIMALHEEGDDYYTSNIEGDKRRWSTEIEAVEALLPNETTDANGFLKPMKCTPIEKAWNKVKYPCLVQPKLDGVRCFILFETNTNKWIALSSSGKRYDVAARFILHSISLTDIDKNLILDGELYIHGTPLQTISGWCRKQEAIPEHAALEFHLFDIARNDIRFEDRYLDAHSIYSSWVERFSYSNQELLGQFKKVVEVEAKNKEEVREIYKDFVEQGYEGAIVRNLDLGYEFGKRSTNIFKLKDFKDEEFDILDIEPGKRGSEDMVFVCYTKQGKEFKANPIGNREQKEFWFNNPDSWRGKKGTIRYLTLSNDGIPQGNPILKAIRDYE